MRRPGADRRLMRVGSFLGPDPLFKFSDGTFNRASAATWWDGTLLRRYASGELRRTGSIAGRPAYLFEGARTNEVPNSNDLTAGWSPSNATIDPDFGKGPDGSDDAENVDFDATGAARASLDITTLADSTNYAFSAFAKQTAGDWSVTARPGLQFIDKSGGGNLPGEFADVPEWQRIVSGIANSGVGATTPSFRFRNNSATDREGMFWGAQVEAGEFSSSLIETNGGAATRVADDLAIAGADAAAAFNSGPVSFWIKPEYSNTELAAHGVSGMLYFGDTNNYVAVIQATGDFRLRLNGLNANVGPCTWSAGQVIKITVDCAGAGSITVEGCTTGDGTASVTPASWPSAAPTQVGNSAALTQSLFGLITEPYAA